ncbi:MAG: lipopolysaccharide biosynthesis protein [Bacteroidales bacterium]
MKSASVLAIGTLIAQSIPILLQPFLRRYFSPEDFGIFSVYTSIIGILMVIASFRYEQTIVLPKRNSDSVCLLGLSIINGFIFSLILLILILLLKDKFAFLINIPQSKRYIVLLIPLSTFLLSVFQALNFWLIRKKAFVAISSNKLSRRIMEGVSQSIFAFKGVVVGLIWGDLIGQIANVATSLYQSIRKGFNYREINLKKMWILFNKYSDFPKYNLLTSALSAASFLMPVIFINKLFSNEYAGYFDLSKLMLSIPLALIASSFSSVVLQKVSEKFQIRQSIYYDLKPIIVIVSIIAILEILIVLFFGENIFTLFFGKSWQYSGVISKMLVWAFALNFIASTFTSVFVALNRIKVQSVWQLVYFLLIISILYFNYHSFESFLWVYISIEIFSNLFLIGLLILVLSKYEASIRFSR